MIKEIKEKIKNGWEFVKKQWKKIVLIIIGGSVAFAFNDLTTNEISLDKITQKYEQAKEIKEKYQLDGVSLVKTNIKNAELDVYKGEPKDEIKVTLGDKDKTEFVPNIELKRWNEVSFKIKTDNLLKDVATKDKTLKFEGDKIKFGTPKISFEMYEDEEGYHYDKILNVKPDSNKIIFDLEVSNLDFFFQPPLNAEQHPEADSCTETQCFKDGQIIIERPENIVGSWAIYHSTKGGLVDSNGKAYGTGKAFHIFRPKATDKNGNWVWCDLFIDVSQGIYRVTINQKFIDEAIYPIKVE